MRTKSKARPEGAKFLLSMLKGALLATALCLLLVLLYALALKQGWLKTASMPAVTPAIKVVGAAFAAVIATIGCNGRRWLLGGAAGLAFSLLSFMIYSILSSTFELSLSVLSDMGIGLLAGALTAMIKSLLHR